MHRPLSLLAVACALAGCSSDAPTPARDAAAPVATPVPAPRGDSDEPVGTTRLTIYSGDYEALAAVDAAQPGMPGYALVERPLHYSLKEGLNTVSATGVPPAIDAEAAVLRAQSAGVGVESQRYVAPLGGSADVTSQVLGQRVTVEHTAGGAKQTDTGTLVAAGEGLTLALADGRIKVIRQYDSFSVVDGTRMLPQHAELQWTVRASGGGDADFVLSYPMGGLAWRAEYLATIAEGDNCQLSLDGAAMVANRAGVTFSDASLTLVAGEPNRVQPERRYMARGYAQDAMAAAPAPEMAVRRESGEYHAYEVPGTTAVRAGSTERVPLFARVDGVACERAYVVDAGGPEWEPPRPLVDPGFRGETGDLPVTAAVSIRNSAEANLGQPLPAGRARIYDGGDFLGESTLGHTPAGAELRFEVGTAFDLTARRENTGFNVDRSGRTITESFAITLANARDTDVSINVVEPLPRWSDWEVVSSSVPAERRDARHAEFTVTVPAGGETRLAYTVRYRWPEGVTP